jgi:hypothetical protein
MPHVKKKKKTYLCTRHYGIIYIVKKFIHINIKLNNYVKTYINDVLNV